MIVGMSLESFIGTSSKFLAEPSGSRCSPCGRIAGHRQPFHAGRTWRCETNADGPDGAGRRHRPDRAQPAAHPLAQRRAARSEERRVGKSVDLGGRRNIKKKKKKRIAHKKLKKDEQGNNTGRAISVRG